MPEITPKRIEQPANQLKFKIEPRPANTVLAIVDPAHEKIEKQLRQEDESYVLDIADLPNNKRCNVGFFKIDGCYVPYRFEYDGEKYVMNILQ